MSDIRETAEQRRGLVMCVATYVLWGLIPLYWPYLKPAGPLEILAHRIVWSLVFMVAVLAVLHRWAWVGALLHDRVRLVKVSLAGLFITTNWGLYVWGVNSDQVVETSLGYFINPLAFIAIGVLVLGERLRTPQWAAVGLGVAAVLLLTVGYGRLPWLALALAACFTVYGYLKKTGGLGATESVTAETGVMFLPTAGYLAYQAWAGQGTFGSVSVAHSLLLVSTAAATILPLLLFGAATARVPLSTVGMVQYLAPVFQFIVGVWVNHEAMPASRWAGFGLIWAALAVLVVDAVWQARRGAARSAGPDTGSPDTAAAEPRRALGWDEAPDTGPDAAAADPETAAGWEPAPDAAERAAAVTAVTPASGPADPARAPARAPRSAAPSP